MQSTDAAALHRVHARLGEEFPGLLYDTTYLPMSALAEPATPGLITPFSQDGRLWVGEPAGEVHAVTWFTLPEAVPAAGLGPARVSLAADRAAAEAHCRGNLQIYLAAMAEGPAAAGGVTPWGSWRHTPGQVLRMVRSALRKSNVRESTMPSAGGLAAS